MTELLEKIAIELIGIDEFECPFDHDPRPHTEKNKIPPENSNSSGN